MNIRDVTLISIVVVVMIMIFVWIWVNAQVRHFEKSRVESEIEVDKPVKGDQML